MDLEVVAALAVITGAEETLGNEAGALTARALAVLGLGGLRLLLHAVFHLVGGFVRDRLAPSCERQGLVVGMDRVEPAGRA